MLTETVAVRREEAMIGIRRWSISGLVLCGGFLVTPFLPVEGARSSLIKIDGSSTVYPVTEAVAEEFQKSMRGKVRVTVGISGTGGGFKKFCRGETDISDASRPILKEEIELCRANGVKYIELPVAYDALTVVVNPQNTWVSSITVADLKKMWDPGAQGKITRWNQVRAEWPNEPLVLFGPGTDSGTFDYFTEAVVGKGKSSRGDFTGSEDDNVLVQGVAANRNALGYIPFAYFAPHAKKLKALSIDNGHGPVSPSMESVMLGHYNPLSRPLFIYVKEAAAKRQEVKAFVEFYLTSGAELAEEVKYTPLPRKAYDMAHDRFLNGRLGSGFRGVAEVGMSIEDILKREPRL